jgi:hypothetical protein
LRWLPAEDSRLAAAIRGGVIVWRGLKWGLVLLGVGVIWQAGMTLRRVSPPPVLLKSVSTVLKYFLPVLLDFIEASLYYLWQPIAAYLVIILLTKSLLWRKFWCLVGVAACVLLFMATYSEASWKDYQRLPLLVIQGYLFTLWLVPREFWNLIGLLISVTMGVIVLILPDLPTAFDDFGIFSAILVFFLGYLNALANLIQRAVRS